MNDQVTLAARPLFAFGTPMEGGFFAGLINIKGTTFGLAVADKAEGEHADAPLLTSYTDVTGACSVFDGAANTAALAEAGSELAKWAQGLILSGHADWYLPSRDEVEVLYRNLKPGTSENYTFGRHGENLSAVPPTYAYTSTVPAQTTAEVFQADGAQAFDTAWYWTSTQYSRGNAWFQSFSGGYQLSHDKFTELRARAVRRFKVE
jgi:hypothetical protein